MFNQNHFKQLTSRAAFYFLDTRRLILSSFFSIEKKYMWSGRLSGLCVCMCSSPQREREIEREIQYANARSRELPFWTNFISKYGSYLGMKMTRQKVSYKSSIVKCIQKSSEVASYPGPQLEPLPIPTKDISSPLLLRTYT